MLVISRISRNGVVGGAELSARDIARSLNLLKEPYIYITNIQDDIVSKDIPENKKILIPFIQKNSMPLSKVLYGLFFIRLFIVFLFLAIRYNPKFHPQSREDQIISSFFSWLYGASVIWRDPGDIKPQLSRPTNNIVQNISRSIFFWAIKKANAIITLNDQDKDFIIKKTGIDPSKVKVIPSNILFSDYTIDRKNKKNSKIIIGTIIRLEKSKGVDILISAYLSLRKKGLKNVELHIIGSGSIEQQLVNMSRNDSSIFFYGYKKNVSNYYNFFDIFVQPAREEGWGRNLTEAFLHSNACIASNTGGLAKQIINNKNGLLFKPGSYNDLEEKILKLVVESSLRHKLSVQGNESVIRRGDWKNTVEEKILTLFEKY